jgi:hypothetical protein
MGVSYAWYLSSLFEVFEVLRPSIESSYKLEGLLGSARDFSDVDTDAEGVSRARRRVET